MAARDTFWIELAYDGSQFQGWQSQPHGQTVQDALQRALYTITNQPIKIQGCGRTDAGVHADAYVASFDWIEELQPLANRPERFWRDELRRLLPDSIVVHRCYKHPLGLQARFDAARRDYAMRIQWGAPVPLQLQTGLTFAGRKVDYPSFVAALQSMIGDYECAALAVQDRGRCNVQNIAVRDVEGSLIAGRDSGQAEIRISADRFVRRMVRSIVGAAWAVGEGRLSVQDLKQAITQEKRHHNMKVAGGQGLRLIGVQYPDGYYQPHNQYLDWWRAVPWHDVMSL